ncbi:family 4 glycosyl hydrolase [Vallitalea okinawensis]|uniref:family 4 glycosyl hydrolase n=1 Tax=Vallitalea okinawensis TaxID=2078660 RepID=UPI000CFC23D2|nr:glycoside hydrolase [Vallitalea okinawensis]
MKLVVLGGGGVRSPFLAKSIVSNAHIANITEVVFMDNDGEKLNIFGGLSKIISERINSDIQFDYTTDAEEALKDADFIITTLRVGGDVCRTYDERVCLDLGVLGQETTGAGGFGMAMRSIPTLLEYCDIIKKVSKENALIFNFTNPSGLVTQALRDAGHNNVYGICDAPSEFIKQMIRAVDSTAEEFSVKCYGLNHLSWFKDAKVNGVDVMDKLLNDEAVYNSTDMRSFDRELVKIMGDTLMNDYLQYYYYRERKVDKIKSAKCTRGETILDINARMFEKLKGIDVEKNYDEAFDIYMEHYMERENSYGLIETGVERIDLLEKMTIDQFIDEPDEGGYAGVALNFIKAFVGGKACEMVLSIPNNGAIKELEDTDVVEISCIIEKGKVTPVPVDDIHAMQVNLMKIMKLYERTAVKAITNTSREKAIKALTIHPLVNSYSLAKEIVDQFIDKYQVYTAKWH